MCISRCYALSGGLLMEASPTCFCALLAGIKQAFSDTRCHVIWCTPQQLLSQLLHQCLRAQKQTTLNQSVVTRIRCHNSLSQGLTFSQRSPATPVSLTAFTGLFQSRQDGGQNSVPNLRSLGSSPCYSGLCRMVRPRCQASSDPGLT